jgi:hypothetical protein
MMNQNTAIGGGIKSLQKCRDSNCQSCCGRAFRAYIASFPMKKALFLIVLVIPAVVFAQLNNQAFEQRMSIEPSDSGKLYFGINMLGFAKDNEFFDTVVEGYTLFGYQLNPYLSYNISENVRLDAGVYAQKDFGNDDYSDIKPTLSLKIRNNNFNFIFGTLEGNLHHRLIEPLYDFERVLNNRLENGAQVVWMKEGIFLDAWINWQKMIYTNSVEPERFTAGVSFNKTLFDLGDIHIDLPLQMVAAHQGGQIDTVDNEVITRINMAGGLTLEGTSAGFVSGWGVKAYGTMFSTNANKPLFNKEGVGYFINPYLKTRIGLTVMASYWHGDRFMSIEGSPLYASANELYPDRIDRTREFLMLRFLYDVKVTEGLTLTARAEPFLDTYSQELEYSFGLYLNFSERFFLLNAKKSR